MMKHEQCGFQTPRDVLNILHTSNDFQKKKYSAIRRCVCVENLGQRVMYL